MQQPVYIVEGLRTPVGGFQGGLSSLSAPQLAAPVLAALMDRLPGGLSAGALQQVILGQVLTAGAGQAPARQALRLAGLPDAVAALTINKVCGSGLMAVMLAAQHLQCQPADDAVLLLAGGMESMSQAPYLLTGARTGYRYGHQTTLDSLLHDGLWDPYHQYPMGMAGELCAKTHAFSREQQDTYARRSYERAQAAVQQGLFDAELIPVTPVVGRPPQPVSRDEEPFKPDLSRLPGLKPVFDAETGTITAGNASKLNDGAAAVLMANEAAVQRYGLTPKGRLIGMTSHSQAPEWFTTAPIGALQALLRQIRKTVADVEVIEINEAFAVVPLVAQQALGLSDGQLNPRGGAIALGHPIGASGARLLVTLLHTLTPGALGLACLCIGGGEAVAVAIERL